MLKRKYSLKTNFEFNIPKKYGDYYEGKLFHMYVLKPTNYKGVTKVGVVISNKFDKRAVVRNNVKRMFKRAVKTWHESIKDLGLWIVIYPKFNSVGESYEEISTDFTKVIQKAHLTRELWDLHL